MSKRYNDVTRRFLRNDERFMLSSEKEMPLVIEANTKTSCAFLMQFLVENSSDLIQDLARYGAILLRGFEVNTDQEFEQILLTIPEFEGISNAFMAENGRTHVENSQYVLHTNSVYKTGGTLYLGGFHTENYYSTDVPAYISFCCLEPSALGGETGIINTQKIYNELSERLKTCLEERPYFVSKWLVSEVMERYQISAKKVERLAAQFKLPIIGKGSARFILMYKPSVLQHPFTKEKALQINLFEVASLNKELRQCFLSDYHGSDWFWHRFFWRLPGSVFSAVEAIAVPIIAFFNSPRNALRILRNKISAANASKNTPFFDGYDNTKVGTCFSQDDVKQLARSMRNHYSSCLWKKGDIMIIDNRKVMHAGMPGKGERLIRAMICNPIAMDYSLLGAGCLEVQNKKDEQPTLAECILNDHINLSEREVLNELE